MASDSGYMEIYDVPTKEDPSNTGCVCLSKGKNEIEGHGYAAAFCS